MTTGRNLERDTYSARYVTIVGRGGGPSTRYSVRKWVTSWVLIVMVVAGTDCGLAAQSVPPLESSPLEHFARTTFPVLADSFGVPGAALAVVDSGGPVAMQGYGVADVRSQVPIDSERTLFRVASVSKPVTATAILLLAERHQLDLHVDVNAQLGELRVPAVFGVPIRPHDLLTHTAGFDERIFGGGDPTAAPDLQEYLAATLPERVYPPGALHAYSNHGYGLLGALLEDATGLSFPGAMDELVLKPLGMTASTFAQPPPPQLRPRLATGHACGGDRGSCVPLPYDYLAFAPAGALQTTVSDLGRFAAAQLTDTGRVLGQATLQSMQAAQWRGHPSLTGMGYGWHRGLLGRYEALRHAGGWAGWSAQAIVVPGAGVGYVVAVNTDDHGLLAALAERFAAEVLGGPLAVSAVPDGNLNRYEGKYRLARHVHHGADRVAILAGFPMPDLQVEAAGDTVLLLTAGPSVRRVISVGDGAFVEPGLAPRRFAFVRDGAGRLVLHGDYASLERLPWWATRRTTAWALGCSGILLLVAVVAMHFSGWRGQQVSTTLRRARVLATLGAICLFGFVAALVAAFLSLGPQGLVYGLPGWVRFAFVLPVIGGVCALAATVPLGLAMKRREGSWWAHTWLVTVIFAILGTLPVLAYWNLLGLP